jgi:hypothetical protein
MIPRDLPGAWSTRRGGRFSTDCDQLQAYTERRHGRTSTAPARGATAVEHSLCVVYFEYRLGDASVIAGVA